MLPALRITPALVRWCPPRPFTRCSTHTPRVLSPAAFAALMAATPPPSPTCPLAVAVSGGPDSTALLLLLAEWAGQHARALTAVTVDHGLRGAESAAEAASVAKLAASLGVPHTTLPLSWADGRPPPSRVQAAARTARYTALSRWCVGAAIPILYLGHTADDQAETLLGRWGRGSGLAGLGSMAPLSPCALHGAAAQPSGELLLLARPLLPVPKDTLVRTVQQRGVEFAADPSNLSLAYDRVRVRMALGVAGGRLPPPPPGPADTTATTIPLRVAAWGGAPALPLGAALSSMELADTVAALRGVSADWADRGAAVADAATAPTSCGHVPLVHGLVVDASVVAGAPPALREPAVAALLKRVAPLSRAWRSTSALSNVGAYLSAVAGAAHGGAPRRAGTTGVPGVCVRALLPSPGGGALVLFTPTPSAPPLRLFAGEATVWQGWACVTVHAPPSSNYWVGTLSHAEMRALLAAHPPLLRRLSHIPPSLYSALPVVLGGTPHAPVGPSVAAPPPTLSVRALRILRAGSRSADQRPWLHLFPGVGAPTTPHGLTVVALPAAAVSWVAGVTATVVETGVACV